MESDQPDRHGAYNMAMNISMTDLEQAINFWRDARPSKGEEHCLSPEVGKLATVYALVIYAGAKEVPSNLMDDEAQELINIWRQQQRA